MFSNEARCNYANNQLGDVICQLRFPEILSIGANVPVAFQEAIRHDFPQYAARQEVPAPKSPEPPATFPCRISPRPSTISSHPQTEIGV